MLIKSLFKSSFSQSDVVLRSRFVICSGDLYVVDKAGRQVIVVERALFSRSAGPEKVHGLPRVRKKRKKRKKMKKKMK